MSSALQTVPGLVLAVALILAVILPPIVVLGRRFVRQVARPWLDAHITQADRDALYAAVKVGLRVATSYGFELDQLLEKAVEVACTYLKTFGITVPQDFLLDLIRAEAQKRDDKAAELGAILNPPLDPEGLTRRSAN